MPSFIPPGLGWQSDLPDPRDYSPEHERVRPLLAALKRERPGRAPAAADWRTFFPPAECQHDLPAGCAHACVALVAYFERRASGRCVEGSRLFLHQTAGLPHAAAGPPSLRRSLKALVRFGLPPEGHWPYEPDRADEAPPAHLYCYGSDYGSLVYLRVAPRLADPALVLARLKAFLAAGFAVAFGFTVFDSLSREPLAPFPTCYDAPRGGQAAVALGYDDGLRIFSERGALLFRSPWGEEWGEVGYGWLPYRYVTERLAADFWTVLRPDWLASGEFRQPA